MPASNMDRYLTAVNRKSFLYKPLFHQIITESDSNKIPFIFYTTTMRCVTYKHRNKVMYSAVTIATCIIKSLILILNLFEFHNPCVLTASAKINVFY